MITIIKRILRSFGIQIKRYPDANLKSRIKIMENYTINQLENALIGATTWNQWRDNLINNEANNTEQFLNELFANWTN